MNKREVIKLIRKTLNSTITGFTPIFCDKCDSYTSKYHQGIWCCKCPGKMKQYPNMKWIDYIIKCNKTGSGGLGSFENVIAMRYTGTYDIYAAMQKIDHGTLRGICELAKQEISKYES